MQDNEYYNSQLAYQKMKLVILCLFFLSSWALPRVQNDHHFKRIYVEPSVHNYRPDWSLRIINGNEAVPNSIPYQVLLISASLNSADWLCGGVLISPTHILTAAHCLEDAYEIEAHLGTHNIDEYEPSQLIKFSQNLIMHEEYDEDKVINDIGIVVLDDPLTLNENINIVALPSEADANYEGDNVRTSGWGSTSGDSDLSPVLLEVNSTVISNVDCKNVFANVTDSQVCISGDNGVGACNGDSGGPLIDENTLIGIVSYGATGCPTGYPTVFVKVSSYLDWIEKNTGLSWFR